MMDLANGMIQVPGHLLEPIKEWAVWFVTDEGTLPTLKEAQESCDRTGRPYFAIIPVPVAIGATTYEIVTR